MCFVTERIQIAITKEDGLQYYQTDASGVYNLIPYYQRIDPDDAQKPSHEPRYIIQKHPINGQFLLTKVEGMNRSIVYPESCQYEYFYHATVDTLSSGIEKNTFIEIQELVI